MLHGLSVSRTLIKAAMGFCFDKVESAREVNEIQSNHKIKLIQFFIHLVINQKQKKISFLDKTAVFFVALL